MGLGREIGKVEGPNKEKVLKIFNVMRVRAMLRLKLVLSQYRGGGRRQRGRGRRHGRPEVDHRLQGREEEGVDYLGGLVSSSQFYMSGFYVT